MQILRKILSLTLACALTLSMGAVTALAAAPDTSGDIIAPGISQLKATFKASTTKEGHSTVTVTGTQTGNEVRAIVHYGEGWDDSSTPNPGDDVNRYSRYLVPIDNVRVKEGDYVSLYEYNPTDKKIIAFIAHKVAAGETEKTLLKNTNFAGVGFEVDSPDAFYDGRVKMVEGQTHYTIKGPKNFTNISVHVSPEDKYTLVTYDDNSENRRGTITPDDLTVKVTVVSDVSRHAPVGGDIDVISKDYTFTFLKYYNDMATGDVGSGSTGGSSGSSSTDNTANKPETVETIKDTMNALKDPTAALPAGVTKTTTAGGAAINTIPVPMLSGSATVGMEMLKTLGSASTSVGIKFSVSAGLTGGSMEVIVPGGFGQITEPGRFAYSMDYANKAESNDDMLKAVKGENVTSTTAKIGGNQTLPVTATITVATKEANGTAINIYKYDPHTGKFIVIGKAVAKDGKLTFGTKIMGEMLFTTGTI